MIQIDLKYGVSDDFVVKHYPSDRDEADARVQTFQLSELSGVTAKLISVLKDIPETQAERPVTTEATLRYTVGEVSDSVTDSRETVLKQLR